jgi:exonuclease SbcD
MEADMISFIHGADFHLDSPFSALPPEQAAERRAEQRALFASLASLAEGVDLVFLAGDLFDGDQIYPETADCIRRTLGQISAPVLIAPGNHDWVSRHSPYRQVGWPSNVHVFDSESVTSVFFPSLGCTVYGAGFLAPECRRSLLEGFRASQSESGYQFMVMHGEVGSGTGAYNPITRQEIEESGLDYLALGHIHQYSGPQQAGNTAYAWPGCPQGRGFDETGEKGVLRGQADETGVTLSFLPLAAHRYWEQSVVLQPDEDPLETILAALPEGTEQDIYRIILKGESGAEGLDIEALSEALAPRFYHVALRDKSAIRQELWARAEEDTLTGLFLKKMREKMDAAPTEAEHLRLQKAVRFGLAALEGREDPIGQNANGGRR